MNKVNMITPYTILSFALLLPCALVLELVDRLALGASAGDGVRVRLSLRA